MTIGTKIESRRKELGLTLEEVGNAVGVGKSTVRKWEQGMIANMRRDKISSLAKVLKMSPSEFIIDDDGQPIISAPAPSQSEKELIEVFKGLSKSNQFKLLSFAYELKEKESASAATDTLSTQVVNLS